MHCPSCGSARVYPSRARNVVERLRQALTGRQPYRCHECNWRKWADILPATTASDTRPEDLRTGGLKPVKPTELDTLDPLASKR
jgi:hypothetical protein